MFWLAGRYVPAGLQRLSVWCGKQFTGRGLAHLTRLTALGALSVCSYINYDASEASDEDDDEDDDDNWHDVRLTQGEVRAAAVILGHSTVEPEQAACTEQAEHVKLSVHLLRVSAVCRVHHAAVQTTEQRTLLT
jgi:hypothetical protein